MKIIWFSWKDKTHPFAGGAEVVTHEMCKRLVRDGHEVILISAGYGKCIAKECIDGYTVVRVGGRFSVYIAAYWYYRKNLISWADLVIEEINIVPFFTQLYVRNVERFLFFHQLGRQIWFYQIFFPLNIIGYLIEPLYLFLLRSNKVITISQSTKNDLLRFGYYSDRIDIISQGINIAPVQSLNLVKKFDRPTILSLGEVRAMKRTKHIIEAFEIAKIKHPDLQLIVAGGTSNKYGSQTVKIIKKSQFACDIKILGRVSMSKKRRLMQRAHIVPMTSVKEGWGLVITEANSQGAPCVVYNVDGLRDSVQHGSTGIICDSNNSASLAENFVKLLDDQEYYFALQETAWKSGRARSFEKSYRDFSAILIKNN